LSGGPDKKPGMSMRPSDTTGEITVVPANEASWDDLEAVFGPRGEPHNCRCQRYKIPDREWQTWPPEARAGLFHDETGAGDPEAETTSGLVAYLDGEPVGWCAVEPRVMYPALRKRSTVWSGRTEDKDDATVWSVTCFVTRLGYRRRHVPYALAAAAVDHAREHGARALEGYAMLTTEGEEITWGELHVGAYGAYLAAGLKPVHRPSKRRVVLRIDFE
jgi:GNAT superfamily N-acetyltransferase